MDGLMGNQIPDDVRKQMLYQTMLQMGAGLLQPSVGVPRSPMGDISSVLAGGAMSLQDQQAEYAKQLREYQDKLYQRKMDEEKWGVEKQYKQTQIGEGNERIEEAKRKRRIGEKLSQSLLTPQQTTTFSEGAESLSLEQPTEAQVSMRTAPTTQTYLSMIAKERPWLVPVAEALAQSGDIKGIADLLQSKEGQYENISAGSSIYDKTTGKIVSTVPGKNIEKTIPLGNKTRIVYTDGTTEDLAMGASPNTILNIYGKGNGLSKLDTENYKQVIKKLPTMRSDAEKANGGLQRIDKMLGLIDSGAAGTTGALKAFIAPYAEALGYQSKALDDAQTYAILAKTVGGSMRLEVIGPGPVSEYEQKLLQKISGGGNTAKNAARELLGYYKSVASDKVNTYNNTVDALSEDVPSVATTYGKISNTQGSSQGRQPTNTTSSGNRYIVEEE